MTQLNRRGILLFWMILAMTAWGGSWVSAKLIAGTASPSVLVFWRFFLSFLSMIPVMLIMKQSFRISFRGFLFACGGAVLIVAYNQLFFKGLETGLAGGGGVIVTTLNPLFTFLFASILFRDKIGLKEAGGLLLGVIGGFILLKIWKFDSGALLTGGNLLFLIAAMLWGGVTIFSHRSVKFAPSLTYSFYLYGLASLFDFIISAPPLSVFAVFDKGFGFWFNVIYLSTLANTFATTLYFLASSRLGSGKASSFTFLVPVSAVGLSWMILGEVPQLPTLIGGGIAVSAVYLIHKSKRENKLREIPAVKN
jgi:drug/metabolite transporter (DMT)-like permease